jgi:hypothetical protein
MKKSLLNIGLTGILLASGLAINQNSLAQKQTNLIRGNRAYDTIDKKDISYERTNLFGITYITGEYNKELNDELNFFICPENEIQIRTKLFNNSSQLLTNQYIPIKVRNLQKQPLEILTDIPLEVLIKDKKKITSKNKIASIQDFTKNIKFTYEPVKINNQDFLVLQISPTVENRKYFDFTSDALPFLLIPFDQLELTMDNQTGESTLNSPKGMFQPRDEKSLYNKRNQ